MNTERIQDLARELSYEDRSALAFGFPMPSDLEKANDELSFDGGDNDLDSADSRMSVNGKWKSINQTDGFDGFDFVEDDFDNFLTKKARERNKKRRQIKKDLKSEGLSGSDARKQARKDALKEIPKDKLKDILKRGLGKVGKAIKVGALAVPRASFLSLMMINFRGMAWKMKEAMTNPKYASKLKNIKAKWNKLGGNWLNGKFQKAISKGDGRKPFFCGKKCKKKLLDADLSKSFTNFVEGNADFYNLEPATSTITVSTWVAIGSSVLGAMTTAMGTIAMSKSKEKEINAQKFIAEKELDSLTAIEKQRIALAEKALIAQGDPIRAITDNPNLTPQEKKEAIALTEDALDSGNKRKIIKYALIGGVVLVAIFVASRIIKNK